MFTLIATGVGVAFGNSLVATLVPSLFPVALRGHDAMVPVYYEAAGMVVTLVLLGQMLDMRPREATGRAVRALLDLSPKTAQRLDAAGGPESIPLDQILVGDHLLIRPGASIPVDDMVLTGQSHVDESMFTGEPVPGAKAAGEALTGGTNNGSGALTMEARAVGAHTMLGCIVAMVGQAQRSKASRGSRTAFPPGSCRPSWSSR